MISKPSQTGLQSDLHAHGLRNEKSVVSQIDSAGHFTTLASLLTASWIWFQDSKWQITTSRPRASSQEGTSRCANHGLGFSTHSRAFWQLGNVLNTLKALFGKEANQIIPYLLPETEFIGNLRDEERNIEINRSMLKADLVHRIRYKRLQAMLNLELQTKDDPGLLLRLLQYHVALYEKHKVPVISVILYLFQTAVQLPPYQLKCADEILLTFNYKVICLWELDAQPIVKNHIIALYTLLPAMPGVYPDLLKQ